jgi:ATP-dependent helicase HrpA
LRRHFVPAPDVAKKLTGVLAPEPGISLEEALADELWRLSGVGVAPADFDISRVPLHLRMRFEILDDDGQLLAASRDLPALTKKLAPSVRAAISGGAVEIERDGMRAWDFGELPESLEYVKAGLRVRGFPALVDQGSAVGVRVLESETQADAAMRQGLRRLLLLNVPSPAKALQRQLPNATKLALNRNAPGGVSELLDDCLAAAVDSLVAANGGPPRAAPRFERLLQAVRAELPDALTRVVTTVVEVLRAAHGVEKQLKAAAVPAALPALVDMKRQLAGLVHRGFVSETGTARLPDLLRYLAGIERRLEKVGGDINRDRARMWDVEQAETALREAEQRRPAEAAVLLDVRWMIEELRVSLFAQSLGTAQPVSLQRILRALEP